MTTLAYKDGVLAADTQITCGERIARYEQKIYRVGPWIFAGLGRVSKVNEFIEWLGSASPREDWQHDENRPSLYNDDETVIILFTPQGEVVQLAAHGDENFGDVTSLEFYAWGSGAEIALGAMGAGASAAQAVHIAARFDIYTGGDVNQLKITSG